MKEVWRMLTQWFRPSVPATVPSPQSSKDAMKAIAEKEEARLRAKLAALEADAAVNAMHRRTREH